MWLCRSNTKAGVALAICVALCAITWSDHASAAFNSVSGDNDVKFGKASGDADLSVTIVVNTSSQKSFTGGAHDMGDAPVSGRFKLIDDPGTAYTYSFPASTQLASGGYTTTLNSFTTSPARSSIRYEAPSTDSTCSISCCPAAIGFG